MRKGSMLIEMIIILGLIVILMILLAQPMKTLLSDVPRGHRAFSAAASLGHLMNCLKRDVEAGKELKTGDDPNMLVILTNTGTLTYHFTPGRAWCIFDNNTEPASEWTLPRTHFEWVIKNPTTVECTGWVEVTLAGHPRKKFYGTHLFYTKNFRAEQIQ